MNRTYALEIIDMIERGVLEANSSLAKEAIYYLLRLKSTHKDKPLLIRIDSIKSKNQ